MRSRLVSSALWAMAGNGTQFTVVFLLLVYLARILEPRDFGLMATVSIGLDLGTRIARWGQVELLQQARYAGDDYRNQSLRFSLALGILFTLIFAAGAVPLGRLYQSPELTLMMLLCAPVFIFSATGSTPEAVLRGEFRFKTLAMRTSVSTFIGAFVAIIFANLGYGALTLAIQRIVQAACAGIWVWTAVDWRPSWRLRERWSPELAREGGSVMIGTLLPVAVPRTIDLLVGLFMGAAVLGIIRVAFRINEFVGQIVVMPLVAVANAELSARVHDRALMCQSYLRLTQASAIMMCPALIGLSLVAPEAMLFLFGPKWGATIPFVEIIGLLALVAPVNYHFASAMVAVGQSKLIVRQGLWQVVLGIGLTFIAAQYSLVAIAISHVVRGTFIGLLNIRDLRRHIGLGLPQLLRSMAIPYLATLCMTVAIVGVRYGFAWSLPPMMRLLLLCATGGVSYLIALRVLAHIGLWPDYHLLADKMLPARWRRRPLPG